MRTIYTSFILAAALLFAWAATAQQTEKRIALVIGNGAYQVEALPTAANDAGLIAQTLQASGFDVVGARDLDQDTLRRRFRDFLEKATGSGPDTVAFVYFAGYGLQIVHVEAFHLTERGHPHSARPHHWFGLITCARTTSETRHGGCEDQRSYKNGDWSQAQCLTVCSLWTHRGKSAPPQFD
jgi:hypothetical protein